MLNVKGGGVEIGADSSHCSWRVAYSRAKDSAKAEILVGVGQTLLGLNFGTEMVSKTGPKSNPKRSKWLRKPILEASSEAKVKRRCF